MFRKFCAFALIICLFGQPAFAQSDVVISTATNSFTNLRSSTFVWLNPMDIEDPSAENQGTLEQDSGYTSGLTAATSSALQNIFGQAVATSAVTRNAQSNTRMSLVGHHMLAATNFNYALGTNANSFLDHRFSGKITSATLPDGHPVILSGYLLIFATRTPGAATVAETNMAILKNGLPGMANLSHFADGSGASTLIHSGSPDPTGLNLDGDLFAVPFSANAVVGDEVTFQFDSKYQLLAPDDFPHLAQYGFSIVCDVEAP